MGLHLSDVTPGFGAVPRPGGVRTANKAAVDAAGVLFNAKRKAAMQAAAKKPGFRYARTARQFKRAQAPMQRTNVVARPTPAAMVVKAQAQKAAKAAAIAATVSPGRVVTMSMAAPQAAAPRSILTQAAAAQAKAKASVAKAAKAQNAVRRSLDAAKFTMKKAGAKRTAGAALLTGLRASGEAAKAKAVAARDVKVAAAFVQAAKAEQQAQVAQTKAVELLKTGNTPQADVQASVAAQLRVRASAAVRIAQAVQSAPLEVKLPPHAVPETLAQKAQVMDVRMLRQEAARTGRTAGIAAVLQNYGGTAGLAGLHDVGSFEGAIADYGGGLLGVALAAAEFDKPIAFERAVNGIAGELGALGALGALGYWIDNHIKEFQDLFSWSKLWCGCGDTQYCMGWMNYNNRVAMVFMNFKNVYGSDPSKDEIKAWYEPKWGCSDATMMGNMQTALAAGSRVPVGPGLQGRELSPIHKWAAGKEKEVDEEAEKKKQELLAAADKKKQELLAGKAPATGAGGGAPATGAGGGGGAPATGAAALPTASATLDAVSAWFRDKFLAEAVPSGARAFGYRLVRERAGALVATQRNHNAVRGTIYLAVMSAVNAAAAAERAAKAAGKSIPEQNAAALAAGTAEAAKSAGLAAAVAATAAQAASGASSAQQQATAARAAASATQAATQKAAEASQAAAAAAAAAAADQATVTAGFGGGDWWKWVIGAAGIGTAAWAISKARA